MAQDSKRKKRERRERRQRTIQRLFPMLQNNLELRQQNQKLQQFAQHASQQHSMAVITLLTVLAQKGGEVEVTKGTLQQIQDDLSKLTFSVDQSETDMNVLVVRMKTIPVPTEEPALTTTHVADELSDPPSQAAWDAMRKAEFGTLTEDETNEAAAS